MDLAEYLALTPVRDLAPRLFRSEIRAWHSSIATRADLGATLSIFGDLGGILAGTDRVLHKFPIGNVAAVLRRPECSDTRSRASLDYFAERADALEDCRITVGITTIGPMVLHGNKRAAAIYAHASDSAFPIRVFVLTEPEGAAMPPS